MCTVKFLDDLTFIYCRAVGKLTVSDNRTAATIEIPSHETRMPPLRARRYLESLPVEFQLNIYWRKRAAVGLLRTLTTQTCDEQFHYRMHESNGDAAR